MTQALSNIERIESKIDRVAAGAIAVSDNVGGIMFESMSEVLEFAKLMSVSDVAVPKHLRGNPGACLSIVTQALEWRMSPFSVANKSYSVNDRMAYESQLIHAVVEARAPLKQRLRCEYLGVGEKRQCVVTGHFKGEVDPVAYTSPEFAKITPKNSPLWKSDPDQQQWYYSVRAFARRYCPDVLLGIYAADELEADAPANQARDVTPVADLKNRLNKGKKAGERGFSPQGVEDAIIGKSAAQDENQVAVEVADDPTKHTDGQLDLAHDVENEVSNKKRAISSADSLEDITQIVAATTSYLKDVKRTDLLADFLSVASAREKKLTAGSAE